MTEYEAQAKQFLLDCNATMEIKFVGKEIPAHWKGETKPHNKYQFTITTPKGKYTNYFWDSLHNTEASEMTAEDYAKKKYKARYQDLTMFHKSRVLQDLKSLKAKVKPTEYDILACLEKYGYDSFSDFCAEFGYSADSISARETFLACGEEYARLRRIFTEEQIMNVSRELKKKEAIKRMEALGLFVPCIKAFKNRDEVQLTEPTGGLYEFSSNKELTAKVQEFEKEHNALVYHVIHTPTMEMDMYNFLYVSDYDEEWDMDNADISDGYVLAYVWNTTVDYFSEFGSIAVQDRFGGLVRIS